MQKNSGIGGQAVIDGIMMRNGDEYSIACRRPDGGIEKMVSPYKSVLPFRTMHRIPILRGAAAFIDSMVVGISSIMWATDVASEDENAESGSGKAASENPAEGKRLWNLAMTGTVVVSIGFSVFLFILLPYWIAGLMGRAGMPRVAVNLMEAIFRIAIFLGYMVAISRMKDIQTTYAYHGAEHKCINCIESGLPLTVENVLKSSRQHRRCGTSFLMIVICISVISFLILGLFDIRTRWMRFLWRIILIPVIAGISYEILRYAGSHEGPVINVLVKPGLALQKLVTREPDAAQAEVAIAAVEAVFDWRKWEADTFGLENKARSSAAPAGSGEQQIFAG